MIKEPLLACTIEPEDLGKLKYPVLCTPKLDGIRCLVVEGKPYTRKLKQIPNKHVRETLISLCEHIPLSLDGELQVPGTFQDITSAIMSHDGVPEFTYTVFDCAIESKWDYAHRVNDLIQLTLPPNFQALCPVVMRDSKDLLVFEKACIDFGHEGIIIRSPTGRYKQGRSTLNEGYLLKLKRFVDGEARMIGAEELVSEAGEIKMNTLGSIICFDDEKKIEFKIGTGFTEEQRAKIWGLRMGYIDSGAIVTYKYQSTGIKDKPRFPVFKGFRGD